MIQINQQIITFGTIENIVKKIVGMLIFNDE